MWSHLEIPSDTTVIEHIKKQTDWPGAISAVGGHRFEPHLSVPSLKVDAGSIHKEINQLYKEVVAVSWQSQESLNIYGLSLTYNPQHQPIDWKSKSFGNSRYRKFSSYEYYKAVNADTANQIKDDYLDGLGFRKILPQVKAYKNLYSLLSNFKFPIVRCTSRTINGALCYPTQAGDGGLHTDDSPFEILRVNVSITNNGDFGLQYGCAEPIFTKPGDNLVVNTDVRHRAYIRQHNDFLRTNLVIGITPWLDYDQEKDSWSLNKYFGKVHPYDIVKQGLLI
jgi:hypothetical protein